MKSFFPDVNVWVALSYRGHQHHPSAASWFESLEGETAYFCRLTQLSFLRLVSHPRVMGEDVRTQNQAWQAYDLLLSDERVSFHFEPDPRQLESALRRLTSNRGTSTPQWPDAYLAAFAEVAGLWLTTFDRALARLAGGRSLLLD
jgi:uncharacterized protein